jgi:hypothetical protein
MLSIFFESSKTFPFGHQLTKPIQVQPHKPIHVQPHIPLYRLSEVFGIVHPNGENHSIVKF